MKWDFDCPVLILMWSCAAYDCQFSFQYDVINNIDSGIWQTS